MVAGSGLVSFWAGLLAKLPGLYVQSGKICALYKGLTCLIVVQQISHLAYCLSFPSIDYLFELDLLLRGESGALVGDRYLRALIPRKSA